MVEDSKLGKNDKNIKKESDLKKFLKKRSFIYLMCAVVFVVFFVPDMMAPSDLENKLVQNFDGVVIFSRPTLWHLPDQVDDTDI